MVLYLHQRVTHPEFPRLHVAVHILRQAQASHVGLEVVRAEEGREEDHGPRGFPRRTREMVSGPKGGKGKGKSTAFCHGKTYGKMDMENPWEDRLEHLWENLWENRYGKS